jgi:hypothetical protein
MALSAEDKAWIVAQIKGIPAATLTADNILESPADAADHETNPFWAFGTYVKDTGARVRKATGALADILAQTRANGTSLTEIKAALARLEANSK